MLQDVQYKSKPLMAYNPQGPALVPMDENSMELRPHPKFMAQSIHSACVPNWKRLLVCFSADEAELV